MIAKANVLASKGLRPVGLFVIAAVVLILYAPATTLSFFGDDYLFIEVAGRSSFWQYLSIYFDPRLQTAWYRPMQGMRYGIVYALFGANPAAYHWVNVLVHLANCLLLFAIIWRVSRRWQMSTLATLIYAGLPLYSVTVFWPGVADFVMTLFYLSSVLTWVVYLQEARSRFYLWSFVFFILALMTKELAVTLPIVLFVVDRIFLKGALDLSQLAKRYLPFLLLLILYLPMEYVIQSRGVFVNTYGYGTSSPLLSNLLQYSAAFVFPWGLPEPWNYFWLVAAILFFGFVVIARKSLALFAMAGIGVMTFLPVVPFPWFLTRYLYVPIMIFATLFALWIEYARTRLRRWTGFAPALSAAIALLTIGHGFGIANAAADFAEIARQSRVPFRDITQRHAQFPNDTLLYFVDPPSPTAEYSGMFFLRYGPGISVSSNEYKSRPADLRAHQNSYVIYFDVERRTREIPVEKGLSLRSQPDPPVAFADSLQLERYEIANASAKRGEAIGLVLYFKMRGASDKVFFVSFDLKDATGKSISAGEQQLHGSANSSQAVTIPLIVPIPAAALAGNSYRLELALLDFDRQQLGGKMIFAPISILE